MNPLSAIYGAIADGRNQLYDRGLLNARTLATPVISVGSISAGGAGKTPFVIMLGEMLRQRGISFDVLSRGYGRRSRGVRIVELDGSAREYGDEPLLIARRLACPVIVGESRYEAGILAERTFKSKSHILDDGFQHRQLHRDFDISLLTSDDVYDRLLPGGRLREPLSSLCRAGAVALIGNIDPGMLPAGIPVIWRVQRSIAVGSVPSRPVVFCGIARPQNFLAQLRTKGIVPAVFRAFRDHYAYTAQDVKDLLTLQDKNGANGFLTTEKDMANLAPALVDAGLQMDNLEVARVEMQLTEPTDALDTMLATIAERRRKA